MRSGEQPAGFYYLCDKKLVCPIEWVTSQSCGGP
jgi:hypothetical protein